MAEFDYLFKFVIIGDTNAGKSCLLRYFLEKKFKKGTSHTIGVEFGSKVVTVAGKKVKLQIWDTAGQERFRSVTKTYYRGAAGCLLVYDITSRETYENLTTWLRDAKTLARPDITVVAVGNKCDRKNDREVSLLEASRFAQDNDLLFMETSALTGECVDEVFLKCTSSIVSKIEGGLIDPDTLERQNKKVYDPNKDSRTCAC
ncbi:hypothetical protein AAMO2058_000626100 [Amorphochlora amoebiformis]|mmetsp:Transcript_15432/g.24434  ORF Transcript_15432/g.24434 Transcript_15432/m.24434 type:complete len:202 (-) Transcript_15432:305-910(-)